MGKIRTIQKEVKKRFLKGSSSNNESLKNTVVKLESDIGAISLGPPRSKILKKSASSSSNFASRVNLQNKQKKKVRFCQNIVAEELKEQKLSSEDAKNYFKVIHPSAIEKRRKTGANGSSIGGCSSSKGINDIIPDSETLLASSQSALRKIFKETTKRKKFVLRAKKESFKRKMELLKTQKVELIKSKQREQTVIVGDMHPMLQALPTLTSDDKETDLGAVLVNAKPKYLPNKTKYSVKKTQKAILDSLKFFEQSGVAAGIVVPKA